MWGEFRENPKKGKKKGQKNAKKRKIPADSPTPDFAPLVFLRRLRQNRFFIKLKKWFGTTLF